MESFFRKVYHHPMLRQEDYPAIMDKHIRVEFSRNEILLEAGKVSNAYYIVESGLCRAFVYDLNQHEITTSFAGPEEILIEVSSLFQRTPAKESLQAMTEGVAWKISYEDFQELFHRIAGMTEWGRAWMVMQLFGARQRALDMLTLSATERYLTLIREQPQILQQVPLKHIATYLGITDTSLSRIRKEISG